MRLVSRLGAAALAVCLSAGLAHAAPATYKISTDDVVDALGGQLSSSGEINVLFTLLVSTGFPDATLVSARTTQTGWGAGQGGAFGPPNTPNTVFFFDFAQPEDQNPSILPLIEIPGQPLSFPSDAEAEPLYIVTDQDDAVLATLPIIQDSIEAVTGDFFFTFDAPTRLPETLTFDLNGGGVRYTQTADGFSGNDVFTGLVTGTIEASRVPEPATLALLGAGLAGLGAAARRRR